jgi:hypothetical protein
MRLAVAALLLLATPALGFAQGDATEDAVSPDDAPQAASSGADPVARLTVVPDGEQAFDLLSGETTLPDGGTIVDAETGLTLRAEFIRYVEGAFIEARQAHAETAGGLLTAPTLRIDVPSLTAVAGDGVTYAREGLELTAASAELRFGPQLVRFDAPRSEAPVIEAQALLLDVATGDAVLLGPYAYQDGPFTLRDERDGAALMLRPTTTDDGTPTYEAANEVDEDLWARLAPLR